jgi:uncharacterized protein YggE
MKQDHPDFIEVMHREHTTIEADRADVFAKVAGSSLFHGQAALQKAQEVAALVADLKSYGVTESRIRLQNVRAETAGGALGRSSSATYWLKIESVTLDQLADVIGIVTSRKHAALEEVDWLYPDDTPIFDSMRERCLKRLPLQAQKIAEQLKVRLLGVWELDEERNDGTNRYQTVGALASVKKARSQAVTAEDFGLEVSHVKKMELTLRAKYRISAFEG